MRLGTMATTGHQRHSAANQKQAPFPSQQLFILALCRICEPIAFMSIFPYIYFMIEDFHITEDASKISVYAGMVTSAFTLAEFSTGMLWGRLSDKIGRKPVLLTGLAGTALSVLIFGFAQSLPVALFARALGGLLNGNIGVLQTTVAELVTVKEQQPRAYSIMPLVWCLGSVVGPMIGGALARPCISYPSVFPPGTIWEKYPYLLPNLFSATAVCFGVVVGLLFLEETHADKKNEPDRGIELGRRLTSWMRSCAVPARKAEKHGLMTCDEEEEQLPCYRTTENSPLLASTIAEDPQEPLSLDRAVVEKPIPTAFTRPVVLNIISYGIMAFHTMTFDQLFPVFLSTVPPEHREPYHLPFKFVDGFGLDTKTIGIILSVQGVYSMVSTTFIFPLVCRRVGPLHLFRLLALSYFLLYVATPYLVLLPDSLRMTGIYIIIIWKCTFSTLAYPSNAILLANSAPTQNLLGTINGVAASTASLCRAFGPTISGFLYAMGLQTGYSGLAWWCSAAVTVIGAFISFQMTEPRGRLDGPLPGRDEEDSPERPADQPAEQTHSSYGATEARRA